VKAGTNILRSKENRVFRLKELLWLLAACVACFTVLIINGSILFYFDSGGYVVQGISGLSQLGVDLSTGTDAASNAGSNAQAPLNDGNNTVHGSRSLIYAFLLALLTIFAHMDWLVLFNTLCVFLAVLLPMRVCLRRYNSSITLTRSVSLPILLSSLGALPFYTAYAMPDVFAAILLIVTATLTVFIRKMQYWEILLGLALAGFAVISHPSHFLMAVLLVPLSAIGSALTEGRGWWLTPLLMLFLVIVGSAERFAFKLAVEKVANSEVFYNPYLTARLIADGPGLTYLKDTCPNPEVATCALYDALQLSDDPMRLTASHITFAKNPSLGSFKLMTEEDQRLVGQEQMEFFVNVIKHSPTSIGLAIFENTLTQVMRYKVDMTIPSESIIRIALQNPRIPDNTFSAGRLARTQSWTVWFYYGHTVLYAVSLLVIAVLLVLPSGLPGRLRVMALMIFFGMLVNALICGGLSQPADRYGGRVIWLLPYMATIMVLFRGVVSRDTEAQS
jgi:hypothetical protein